jgi:RNA polymerase sigma factor (sigma-70 family)
MKRKQKSPVIKLNVEPQEQDISIEVNVEDIPPKNTKPDSEKTFEELIIDNENFVYSTVNKEFKQYPWNVKEDLYSAGKAGLVYAASKFNGACHDNKFISYAIHWIRYYVNEEIRNLYPVKLNQNYVYKRSKIKKFTEQFKQEHHREPTEDEISKALKFSKKVIQNVRDINGGENFSFISFQTVTNDSSGDGNSDDYIENKLVNEYLGESVTDAGIVNIELKDLLTELRKYVDKKDFNMFIDKHLRNLSYSQIAKKYGLNFPSSSKYIIERVEKMCKKLVNK